MNQIYFLAVLLTILCCSCERNKDGGSKVPQGIQQKNKSTDSKRDSQRIATTNNDSEENDPSVILVGLVDKLVRLNNDDISSISNELEIVSKSMPREVLEAVDLLPPGTKRDTVLRNIFFSFPEKFIESAIQWADKSPLSEDKALVKLLLNPNDEKLPIGDVSRVLDGVTTDSIKRDLIQYISWVVSNPNSSNFSPISRYVSSVPVEYRQSYRDQYLYGLMSRDVSQATRFISTTNEEIGVGVRNELGRAAGSRRGDELAPDIVEYASKHQDWTLFGGFVSGWMSSDSIAASTWARSLDGTLLDLAAKEIANALAHKGDYIASREWKDVISDPIIKSQVVSQ